MKIIPELRFPEFEDEGEWQEKKLGEILVEAKLGGNYENGESNKGIPVIKMGNIDRGKIRLEKIQYLPQKISYNPDDILKESDLLFNTRNTLELVGKVAIWRNELPLSLYNSNLLRMTFDVKYVASNSFMNCFFNTEIGLKKLKSIATGTTSVAAIYTKDLVNVEINFPSIPEQQKIASCLSSLDELIAAHSQKLDLLKDHKKGLMQNLFPNPSSGSGGESVPKYRFPEFENDGDWVEKKLGEVAIFINGKAYKQEELLESGKYRVLRVGNFFTNNNWYYSDLELDENKYCEDGDLLYAWSASFGPRVWRGEKVIYHYHIWKVVPSESISNDFLFVLLENETERMKTQNANGFALLHITKGTIENWECKIPKSKEEQQKIASCLSAVDELITAQAERIAQLQQHKKGLMQGLFPKMEG
jgi:type I restriction enzyme S subunit